MHIQTPRFLLRDFTEADRRSFVAYQMDPRYRRLYNFSDTDDYRANELFDLFDIWRRQVPRQNFQVGIFELASLWLCGCAGLRQAEPQIGSGNFGVELTPDVWGHHGVAIEVASALIEFAFSTLDLTQITGDTGSGNRRVERLAQWFGAVIVEDREGPPWMKAIGWQEVHWRLRRDTWEISPARRRFLKGRP